MARIILKTADRTTTVKRSVVRSAFADAMQSLSGRAAIGKRATAKVSHATATKAA